MLHGGYGLMHGQKIHVMHHTVEHQVVRKRRNADTRAFGSDTGNELIAAVICAISHLAFTFTHSLPTAYDISLYATTC